MAKSSKDKPVEWYNSKLDIGLLLANKFIYAVDIYRYGERSFNLEESKFITSTTASPDEVVKVFVKEGVRFKSVQQMVAAPENWLLKNNYVKK